MRIAVVGAGITGIHTCAALLGRGHSVILIDRNPGPAQGASYAPGLLCSDFASHPAFAPESHRGMLRRKPGFFRAEGLMERLKHRKLLSAVGWNPSHPGFAENESRFGKFFREADRFARAESRARGIEEERTEGSLLLLTREEGASIGERFPDLSFLSPEEALAAAPGLSPSPAFASALRVPRDSSCNGTYAARQLLRQLRNGRRDQFEEIYRSKVEKVETKGGAATGVRLSDGQRIPADGVVLANALGAIPLLRGLGVRLPAIEAEGFTMTFEAEEFSSLPVVTIAFPSLEFTASRVDCRMRATGRLLLGAPGDRARKEEFDRLYDAVLGSFVNLRVKDGTMRFWSGRTAFSPDRFPVSGLVPGITGLAVNLLHGIFGVTLAPICAKITASGFEDPETGTQCLADACSPRRFAS